jgi:ferric-dicitrate binding protein FerR (iron transport regulator)
MNPEIHELICHYVDGEATPEEVRRLDDLLRRHSSVRKSLLIAAEMEVNFKRLLAGETAGVAMPMQISVSRRFSWKTTIPWAAVTIVAAAGWAFAIFFAGQYRHDHNELVTLASRLDKIETAGENTTISYGRVTDTRGYVVARHEGQNDDVEVPTGAPIPIGKSLGTCPWGGASMQTAEGLFMRLDRSTVVDMSETDGVFRAAVKKGIFFVTNRSGKKKEMVIATDNGSFRLIDGQIAVAKNGDRTIIEVAFGNVKVVPAAGGPDVVVPPAHYVILSASQKPRVEAGLLALRFEPVQFDLPKQP